jgi:hypothetical protein
MPTRFIGKNIKNRVVRPMKNSVKHKHYLAIMENKKAEVAKEKEAKVEKTSQKENKKQKKSKDMVNENKLSQMEAIAGAVFPKTKVKVEKAEKGLYERTEESTIVLTEDNKMLLND